MRSTDFVLPGFLASWLVLASTANGLFWQDLDGARPVLPGNNQQPLDNPPEIRPSFQHPPQPVPPVSHPKPYPYYGYGYGSHHYDPYHPYDPIPEHPHQDVHHYYPYGQHMYGHHPYGYLPEVDDTYPHGYYPHAPLPHPYPGLYPPLVHQPYPTHTGYQPYEGAELGCHWKIVFKAVAGNHRDVFADYNGPGSINLMSPHAKELASPLVYRDGKILDMWDHLIISKVKVELFVLGVRGVWFIFDGLGSRSSTWFDKDRLIASPYHDVKSGVFEHFSIEGDSTKERRFFMSRSTDNCAGDCGYMAVVNEQSTPNCQWEQAGHLPLFVYSTLIDTCGKYQDKGEVQYADRMVISVKVCDVHVGTD